MVDKVCSDTGPILHLHEINKISLLRLFKTIFISENIKTELLKYNINKLPSQIHSKEINKDQTIFLVEKYNIDIGEASVIWLCKSLGISLFLTDDLTAREIANYLGIKPVGTIGIIMRCYREKIISKQSAIEILKSIHQKSTLFITSNLINYAISEIERV